MYKSILISCSQILFLSMPHSILPSSIVWTNGNWCSLGPFRGGGGGGEGMDVGWKGGWGVKCIWNPDYTVYIYCLVSYLYFVHFLHDSFVMIFFHPEGISLDRHYCILLNPNIICYVLSKLLMFLLCLHAVCHVLMTAIALHVLYICICISLLCYDVNTWNEN